MYQLCKFSVLFEYNSSKLGFFKGENYTNMKKVTGYCPILGRKVIINKECNENSKYFERHIAVCQNGKKECKGRCEGCML